MNGLKMLHQSCRWFSISHFSDASNNQTTFFQIDFQDWQLCPKREKRVNILFSVYLVLANHFRWAEAKLQLEQTWEH